MLRNGFVGVSLLLVMGCAPLNLFYKEGTPVEQLNSDQASCQIEALKAVPVDRQTRIIPGTQSPKTFCNAAGVCQTIWVKISPDRIETYDANEYLRDDYVDQCMVIQGYEKVRLPPCPNDVVETTQLAKTRVLPPINANSCAIRLKGGGWQVVNPPG